MTSQANHTKEINTPEISCVSRAVKVVGNKWTPLIIRELYSGTKRFCQIEDALDGISPRTLSQRLSDLEKCKIITKKSFAERPPRTDYCLTDKGRDLLPILQDMADWGAKYKA